MDLFNSKKIISVLTKNYFVYSNPFIVCLWPWLYRRLQWYTRTASSKFSHFRLSWSEFYLPSCDYIYWCVQRLCTCSMTDSHKSMKAYRGSNSLQ
jgi:hypothetical protein